jgi:dsDNA-specific endonuclease/ATPase MutS2
MPPTNFKRGDRVRIKETGQTGTVVEIRQHAPRGRSGYYIAEVVVRVDGVAAPRPFQEPELARIT